MKKKIILLIIAAIIVAAGIGGYFYFRELVPLKPQPPSPPFSSEFERNAIDKPPRPPERARPQKEIAQCGDNICDEFEKANPNACPADCLSAQSSRPSQPTIPSSSRSSQSSSKAQSSLSTTESSSSAPSLQSSKPGTSSSKQSSSATAISSSRSSAPTYSSVQLFDSPFGFVQGSFDTNYKFDPSYKNMLDLGVHWDRPFEGHVNTMWTDIENETTGKGNYDFKKTDAALSNFKKDIYLYFSLPIVNTLYGSTLSASNPDGSPYPTDVTAYKNFVKTIVNRYSDKVKYWMVSQNEFDDMEPAAKNLKAYYDEGFDSTVKYAKAACEAIKEVCSDCRPVLGGSVVPLVSFSKKGDTISTPDGNSRAATSDGIHAKLVPAVKESCKNLVIDYHFWYNSDKKDYKTQRDIIDKIKKIAPDLEIWNTESGTVDGMKDITEFEQARDIVRLYVYALSYGQKKLFWTNTLEYDWTQDDSNAFDFMGLINNPKNKDGLSHKKLSYYTYKKMVEVLEGSDWDNIEIIQENDGGYIYKFLKNGKPAWVAWNDNSAEKQITISGVNSSSVKITEAVPNYSSGKDVTNYLTAFSNKIVSAESGKVIIKIKDVPVFIEENY